MDRDDAVLLVTGRRSLVDAVTPVAAAVGLPVVVRGDVEAAGPWWPSAQVVLLGADAAGLGVPVRRPGVVLVADSEVGDGFWRTALEVGAEHAVVLPAGQDWLVQRLAVVAEPSASGGPVLGVVGGRGGAGASTLAACLAVTAARERDVLLVDADPLGAGLDALLDIVPAPGLRWPDLSDLQGPVRGSTLRQLLPQVDGVSLLSWGCGESDDPRRQAVDAVLQAGRRHFGLVVVDLPRTPGPASLTALTNVDAVVLLVPAEVRATLAAARVLARVRALVADVRLVVRGPSPGGLDGEQVADALGLPLAAWLPAQPRVAGALERGELPGRRGPMGRYCERLLGEVLEPEALPWLAAT